MSTDTRAEESQIVLMGWGRRLIKDARAEFAAHRDAIRRSYRWHRIKERTVWRVEGWLLAWVEDVEPSDDYEGRLLAEDEDGDFLVPAGRRNGLPYWRGYWRWWRPDHWPVYIRSRRRRAYVMVERDWDDER